MKSGIYLLFFVLSVLPGAAGAATINFFDSSQTAIMVATGDTYDTISSNGYLFTYTRDKLYDGGNGRPINIPFSAGVAAQAITVAPFNKAEISISRIDGNTFDITAFTLRLLANTIATGANLEVMPQIDGEDALNDPVFFNASGFAGQTFLYNTGTKPQSTLVLKGFDNYKFSLFVDFALTGITLVDSSPPPTTPPSATATTFSWEIFLPAINNGKKGVAQQN